MYKWIPVNTNNVTYHVVSLLLVLLRRFKNVHTLMRVAFSNTGDVSCSFAKGQDVIKALVSLRLWVTHKYTSESFTRFKQFVQLYFIIKAGFNLT